MHRCVRRWGRSGTGRALSGGAHTGRGAFPLTLVDNASPDGAGEWLAAQQLGPGVKVVRLPENVGFGSGHNTVLPQLDSVYHFVVNPDITLDDDAVSKLCAWMDAHPDVVMATPRLLLPGRGRAVYGKAEAQLSGAAGPAGSAAVFEGAWNGII